jgi:purine-binding chemotaxis protein CheW
MSESIEPTNNKDSESAAQLLTFFLDDQEYGVDLLRVQEIRGWSEPMPIPGAPAYIKGVINIRGDVVPIADLRERIGMPKADWTPMTAVVVLRVPYKGRERVMGIVVDSMSDVTTVPQAALKPPPVFDGHADKLTKQIATLPDKMIAILDIDSVFGDVAA